MGKKTGIMALTDQDRAVLDVERRFYAKPGSKEQAITAELGLTPTRYHQALNRIIDDPAALAVDPVLVRRLQRLRTRRLASRGH